MDKVKVILKDGSIVKGASEKLRNMFKGADSTFIYSNNLKLKGQQLKIKDYKYRYIVSEREYEDIVEKIITLEKNIDIDNRLYDV